MRKAMNCRHKGAYRTSHVKGGGELSLRGCDDVSKYSIEDPNPRGVQSTSGGSRPETLIRQEGDRGASGSEG